VSLSLPVSDDAGVSPSSVNSAHGTSSTCSQRTRGQSDRLSSGRHFRPAPTIFRSPRYPRARGPQFVLVHRARWVRPCWAVIRRNARQLPDWPGRSERGAVVGPVVISEIMYHPAPTSETKRQCHRRFLECAASWQRNLPLFDRLSDGTTGACGSGSITRSPTMCGSAPGATVLLVNFDPVTNRTQWRLPNPI